MLRTAGKWQMRNSEKAEKAELRRFEFETSSGALPQSCWWRKREGGGVCSRLRQRTINKHRCLYRLALSCTERNGREVYIFNNLFSYDLVFITLMDQFQPSFIFLELVEVLKKNFNFLKYQLHV